MDAASGTKQLRIKGNKHVFALALQADGKLLAGGAFTQFPTGQFGSHVVRLNPDGSRDTSFSPPPFLFAHSQVVRELAVQGDGKILVGGEFYKVDGAPAHGLVRLNADGSRDTGFRNSLPSDPFDGYYVTTLLILPNGQILAEGRQDLHRLNSDGSVAAQNGALALDGPARDVYALHRLASGKILVGGHFTSIGSQPYSSLARLNEDGTLDTSFVNPDIQGYVRAIHELPNGQILIGGRFTQVQGQPRAHLALLNADGTLDTQFSAPALSALVHTEIEVFSFTRQADGKLLVGGEFSIQEGTVKRYGVARLIPPATHAITTAISPKGSGTVGCSPNPVPNGGIAICKASAKKGFVFDSFSGDCTGTSSTCALTNVTSAQHVIAKFTAKGTTHAITATANPAAGGTVSCAPNPVPNGSNADCTATANTGFVFDSFSGDCTGTSPTCTLTNVTSAKSVTAKFTATATTHAITATANPPAGGTVSCAPNPVPNGGNATCTVTANTGYTFTSFSGDCTGTTCTLTNVTSAKNVTANFTAAATTHAITTAVNPAGSGTVSCTPNPVPNGGDATCTATANTGFAFDGFSGDCTGTSPTCTLTNVTSAKSVTAAFKDVRRRFEGTTVPPSGAGAPAVATFTGGGANCRFDAGSTAFIAAPAAPPSGQSLPHGAFRFKLTGCDVGSTVTMSVQWPGAVGGALKYGRASPSATADSFYAHPGISASGNVTTITLTDGGLGDADNAANGEISDPLAATTAITAGPMGVTAVPTMGHWSLMLLGLAAAGLGARRLRKAA
ncbi:IPTL-CTERM sorting domain-containing protein [Allofranklinella schreckenbergeri]|uniref:IPTL-CTERM sorting domain-containing protein n=1 Tax=Allofranklinella schreckenbergeri TaxID=1076744 RepID=UPI001EEF6AE2|nr:IPTL-CTERM sorting domain-containing protein [Allofranklinella schreckenbergeri]